MTHRSYVSDSSDDDEVDWDCNCYDNSSRCHFHNDYHSSCSSTTK